MENIVVRILKNGRIIKQEICTRKNAKKTFNKLADIAGGMWNGKDIFKVVVIPQTKEDKMTINTSISDDLKSNFRSWEIDNDNSDSLYQLATILSDRHGIDYEEALTISADWIGLDMKNHNKKNK